MKLSLHKNKATTVATAQLLVTPNVLRDSALSMRERLSENKLEFKASVDEAGYEISGDIVLESQANLFNGGLDVRLSAFVKKK